ncbi:MAG: hypothetical protein JSR59_06180 [Proteobacteria bacterium]|nr:hypothetical protein [Pseudomonadota bacterium]
MSMSINSSLANSSVISPQRADSAATRIANRRDGYAQMAEAMQSGDLDAAKSAFATVVRNAPPGATMQPGGPMAQLGKALASGDLSAAQSTWSTIVQNHQTQPAMPISNPTTQVASSTGGTAGATLNVTA